MTLRISMVALISMVATACGGSIPPPTDEWAAAQADVGRAESGGAPSVPDAKLHLVVASETLQKSKALMDQDNRRAASLIAVARVEAQLALSMAKASIAKAQATQAQQEVQKAKGN